MLKVLTNLLWVIAILLLFGGGIFFSVKMGFPQLRFKKLFLGFKNKNSTGVSPFKSLTVSLAARIGVGSLAGIALSIYIGGPGSIFWIWVVGIITSINTFCESYLGLKYQKKLNNEYIGGPYFYILNGLKSKKLAILYALIVIIAYIIGFMGIQANTIVLSFTKFSNINIVAVSLVLVFICAISIMKGIDRIVEITGKIVPIMGIGYIFLSVVIILKNIEILPSVILNIFTSAFNFKAFGWGVFTSFIIGIQRGVFSTEAGLGTGAIATSSTGTRNKIEVGLMQIVGIYFTVFIVCSATALMILTSNYQNIDINVVNGIELTQYALNYHLGGYGEITLVIIVIFLAYSTIVAGYYYGESALKFLINNIKNWHISLLKMFTILFLFVGCFIVPDSIWKIIDIFVAILAIVNMYTLIKLSDKIIGDLNKYKRNSLE